eukprot:5442077-Pleurochrysis_carterae.AAC.2
MDSLLYIGAADGSEEDGDEVEEEDDQNGSTDLLAHDAPNKNARPALSFEAIQRAGYSGSSADLTKTAPDYPFAVLKRIACPPDVRAICCSSLDVIYCIVYRSGSPVHAKMSPTKLEHYDIGPVADTLPLFRPASKLFVLVRRRQQA